MKQDPTPPFWYGLKFFNVYGPYEDHKGRMASVVNHVLPHALRKGRIRLFKSYRKNVPDGCHKRDFVFVDDVVDIMVQLLQTPVSSGIYNAGSGITRTFNDLAGAVSKAIRLVSVVMEALWRSVDIWFIDVLYSLAFEAN